MAVKLTKISANGAKKSEYTYDVGHHITAYIHAQKSSGWDSWQKWNLEFQHSGVTVYSPYIGYSTKLSDIRDLLEDLLEFHTGDPKAAWKAMEVAREERRQAALVAQNEFNDRYEAAKKQHLLDILSEYVTLDVAEAMIADERLTVDHAKYYSVPKDRLPS